MERVTFHAPEVVKRIDGRFVPACMVADPGYVGPTFDEDLLRRFTLQARVGCTADREGEVARALAPLIPEGESNNDIATVFCAPDGQVLHVVCGYWEREHFATEMDFAWSLWKATATLSNRGAQLSIAHSARAKSLMSNQWRGSPLARRVLVNAHTVLANAENGLSVLDLPVQSPVWAARARDTSVGKPLRTLETMGWLAKFVVTPTKPMAKTVQEAKLRQVAEARAQLASIDAKDLDAILDTYDALVRAGELTRGESYLQQQRALLDQRLAAYLDRLLGVGEAP